MPILHDDELKALLATCAPYREFRDRRDLAIMRLFIDTGLRLAELAGLQVDDVDFDSQVVRVMCKGSKPRLVPIGDQGTQAISRYFRLRRRHKLAYEPQLWLGVKVPFTRSGVAYMLTWRGKLAGVNPTSAPSRLRAQLARRRRSGD